jgi:hypothetical protein
VVVVLPTQIVFGLVEHVALSGRGPREGLNELLTACSARLPHPAWTTLRSLDIEPDAVALQHWLARLLEGEPIPRNIKGLYFGLSEYADDDGDGKVCRLHLIGSADFKLRDLDCEWALESTYRPSGGLANSSTLNEIYRLVHTAGPEVASIGEYALGLGYASLVVRTICDELRMQIVGEAAWRGVAVGFDCGDAVVLGQLGSDCWSPHHE